MPLTKPRRRGTREVRYNHLDALGGIKLKAYVGVKSTGGAANERLDCAAPFSSVQAAPSSQPPSC